MVAVEHTSDQDWTQTAPLMAPQSESSAHAVHVAWESDTHTVAPPVAEMAQKPAVCAQSPISPYASAVTPAMHWLVRFAQKLPLSLRIQSQLSGQMHSMEPPHPSEMEPQSSKLAGGSVAQVFGAQHVPSSRQTSAGAQHERPWQTEPPVGQHSSSP
jgi:hypothetical protein